MRLVSIILVVSLSFLSQTAKGAHVTTWSTGLDNPGFIAIDATQVLVTEPRSGRVVRYDHSGVMLGEWLEPLGPAGIAIHPDGRIVVSRSKDADVGVYDASFGFLHLLSNGSVNFVKPTDLTIDDTTGRLYVVDSGADRIYAFNPDESLALIVGIRGDRYGEFKYPSAIAVDGANDRMYIADQDNFRIQVFSRAGVFLFSFGYRIKYLPGGISEGWMPRITGLAVDNNGIIYAVDALMGTLRAFDPSGAELALMASHGVNAGDLQSPTDVAVDGAGRIFVANSNVGSVELYDGYTAARSPTSGIFYRGTNISAYDDLWKWITKDRSILAARQRSGAGGTGITKKETNATITAPGWDPPHMLDDLSCGRCHGVAGLPLGHEGTVSGQANLCQSCHNAGGQASASSIRLADRVDAGGLTPSGGGRSHAWDVPAINAAVGSVGPPAGSTLDVHLDGGNIKCATCHNQHNNDAGSPLLRDNNTNGAMCKQCHADHIGHTPSGPWQPTCEDCHDMHAPVSANLALINTSIYNRTLNVDKLILFTATTGAGSFADGDPSAYDGICEACHTATNYHRHDGSGAAHNEGKDCTSCHPHETGFMPAGGDCTACHAGPQDNGDGVPVGGRRAVVSEFPLNDAHAHYGAILDENACQVCHSVDTHMDGFVELIDPDDGSIYRFVSASDLVGDPDVSNFCDGCHDADGATRLAQPFDPFGNGNAAPDVATKFTGTLQWNEEYGDFCFGNEGTLRGVNSHHDISDADQAFSGAKLECLNCHSAHAVSKSQPTADPFNPTQPWTGTDNEFCMSCHGGGTGPLDPQFPPGVYGPVIDVNDPGWVALGLDWTTILGGACMTSDCSSLRGIDSCDYVDGPWFVDYSWTHSAHGPDSKRLWGGYSGAPGADMSCMACHDPHGSYTPTNTAGNPYMIRDMVDGTSFIDDGTRTGGFNGPPWNTTGSTRDVTVGVNGLDVDWGGSTSLCSACHANWLDAYSWHGTCSGCQTCHGHGMAFGETDFVGTNDTPCPVPPAPIYGDSGVSGTLIAPNRMYSKTDDLRPIVHQAQGLKLQAGVGRGDSSTSLNKE